MHGKKSSYSGKCMEKSPLIVENAWKKSPLIVENAWKKKRMFTTMASIYRSIEEKFF